MPEKKSLHVPLELHIRDFCELGSAIVDLSAGMSHLHSTSPFFFFFFIKSTNMAMRVCGVGSASAQKGTARHDGTGRRRPACNLHITHGGGNMLACRDGVCITSGCGIYDELYL